MNQPPAKVPRNARELAFVVLDEHKRTEVFATQLLDSWLRRVRLAAGDLRLGREIIYGVVRRQATLDALIEPHVKRPRHQVEGGLWTLMQIGAYQLAFLSSVPAHAALHETVEAAKRLGNPRWAGFLNGVLRAVAGSLMDEFTDTPADDAFPLTWDRLPACPEVKEGEGIEDLSGRLEAYPTYRKCKNPVFADPKDDPVNYVAGAFSFPRWLVERWMPRFELDELFRLGFWFNTPPKTCLRVNLLKTTREAFLDALGEAQVEAHAGAHPAAVWLGQATRAEVPDRIVRPTSAPEAPDRIVRPTSAPDRGTDNPVRVERLEQRGTDNPVRLEQLPGFSDGWFAVQDEAAMYAADLLSPRPGETVLDLCAAPGTKTTQLCERMENQGAMLATDINVERLAQVEENARRLDCRIIETRLIQSDGGDIPPGPFDAILIDAPCSNTGVLGKRPEARWRLRPHDISELAALQRRLLSAACDRLRPGGRIVYSTCSIEPEENAHVVRAVLRRRPGWRVVEEREQDPGCPADGGYAVLLTTGEPGA